MPKGIYERPSLIGQKFKELTVIEYDGVKHGHRMWKCLCSCGKTVSVETSRLSKKDNVSCGHLKRDYAWKGYEEISGTYWGQIRRNAVKRKVELNVTIEVAWQKFLEQNRKCAYTGWELIFVDNPKFENKIQTASLDRIDSSKGYIEGNIQWVHKDVNCMKSDFSEKLFLDMCKAIANNTIK